MSRRRIISIVITLALAPRAAADVELACVAPDAPIPDGGAPLVADVTTTVPIDTQAAVAGLRVRLTVAHPWVGDLVVVLTHVPTGTSATLLDRPGGPTVGYPGPFGCGGDDVDAWFDDAATVPAEEMCSFTDVPVIEGDVIPCTPLAVFDGVHPAGPWRFAVADASAIDAGTLVGVCVEVDYVLVCPADFNGDDVVDTGDLLTLIGAWGNAGGDLTGDGTTDVQDVLALMAVWGPC